MNEKEHDFLHIISNAISRIEEELERIKKAVDDYYTHGNDKTDN